MSVFLATAYFSVLPSVRLFRLGGFCTRSYCAWHDRSCNQYRRYKVTDDDARQTGNHGQLHDSMEASLLERSYLLEVCAARSNTR